MAAILTAKSWREFLDMAAIPRLNWVMSTRFSASSTRLVSGRSGVRPPNAAPGQTTYGPSRRQRVTAILTAKALRVLRFSAQAVALAVVMSAGFIFGQVVLDLGRTEPTPAAVAVPIPVSPDVEALLDMIHQGQCWTGGGGHDFAHHAWYLNTTTGAYHYGAADQAYRITFDGEHVAHTAVAAFCE